MRRSRLGCFNLLIFAVLFSAAPLQSFAQAVYGSISGTVSDKTGGVVPGATVTVINVSKGTSDTTTTNASGNYTVTHLVPDVYSVRIEAPSFQKLETKNVQVSVDTIARVDGHLEAGSVQQSIEVTAEAPQLQTERADVAMIFNERAVEQLPIFNRNFTNFLLLSPGTTKMGWSHASSENPQGSQQIFVNGQQFAGTAYELDGTDNQDPVLGIIVVNPNLDSITETKITSQNYDAEFGKAIAGVVTSQTKSGGNSFHGSAFEFRRSDVFQARDPFANFQKDPITGRYLPPTLWNQFGGSIGGPIIKNKLFFFGDYQGTREKSGNSFLQTVPTNLVRSTCLAGLPCDLSEYLNGGKNQIYHPGTATPYANNIIPASQISPQAVALLKLLPAPSTGGTVNNYIASGFGIFDRDGYDVRIDHATTQKLHIFGRYSYQSFNLSAKGAFGAGGGQGFGPGGFAGVSKTRNQSLASGFDYQLSPTLITDFRFGYFRYHVNVLPNDYGSAPLTAAGIPGLNFDKTFTSGLAQFNTANGQNDQQRTAGLSEFGDGLDVGRCNCPLTESENQIQFVNNWTKIIGNHEIKFGGDIRYARNLRVPSDRHRTGEISFNQGYTSNGGAGGSGLATLLLGEATKLERYVSTSTSAAERQKRMFFYGQDTWRITPKLTLNYGLRWEDYFPETVNKAGNGALLNLSDGNLYVAGVGGVPLNMGVENALTAFAPRLGVAYQVTPSTVVRLGYGRSFDIGVFGSVFGHTVTQNLPVLANQNLTADSITSGVFSLAQGPPAPTFAQVPSNGLLPLPIGINGRARPFRMRIPTLDAYNFTIQKQITRTLSGEIAYVGNKGTHVFAGNNPDMNANQPTVIGFKSGLSQAERRPFFAKYRWTQDITYFGNLSSSNYNALQARIDKRFDHGVQLQAHYTWSRALNYDQDYFFHEPHYGLVDFNRKHVFVMNSVYELPFGRGKMFAANVSRFVNYIIGGYQLSGTFNWSSGLPFSVSYSQCRSDVDVGPCWASQTGATNVNVSSLQTPTSGSPYVTYFAAAPAALSNGASFNGFTRPAPETFGTRNSLYGPHYTNIDMAVAKNIPITEKLNAQFRVEAFNVANHPQLGLPDGCIDCGGTAGRISGLQGNIAQMRNLQFGLRLDF
jgi:hypothetical protein